MSAPTQHGSVSRRRKVYRNGFAAASVLVGLGFLFWPLELDVYWGQDGTLQVLWNDEPAVSTETAAFWSYYSLRPLLYFSVVTAVVALVLYRHEDKNAG